LRTERWARWAARSGGDGGGGGGGGGGGDGGDGDGDGDGGAGSGYGGFANALPRLPPPCPSSLLELR